MEKAKIPDLKASLVKRYPKDTLAGKLETAMHEAGINYIGDPKCREKFTIEKGQHEGDVRWSGFDMDDSQRAYRTADIIQLSLTGLKTLHLYKDKRMVRFAIGPSEINPITKEKIRNQTHLDEKQIAEIKKFNGEHKPTLTREFLGYKIPPYFWYDMEFDGMLYHHEWDMNVWNEQENFVMPLKSAGSESGKY